MLRVFRHERPEWIPIIGACDAYNQPSREGMDPELAAALGDVRGCDDAAVILSRYLELDLFSTFRPPVAGTRSNVTIEHRQEGDETTNVWHTPRGDLWEVLRRADDGAAPRRMKFLLEKPEDIPALASIYENETFEVDQNRLPELEGRRKLIGEDGMVAFPMPGTPLGMLIRMYAGPENIAYLCADAPEAMRDLMSVIEENHVRQFSLAAPLDCDALLGMDDTSTTTQSPRMFEEFCTDYTNRVAKIVHDAGKVYLHHSCGLIRDLLDAYAATEMDGVHAFCPPPLGDVTIREGRQKLGEKIIFASFIQMFVLGVDRDWVRESVRQMFEEAAPGTNIIFGIGGDQTKTMDDMKFLREECRQYQTRLGYSP